jgi:hypothetical protein
MVLYKRVCRRIVCQQMTGLFEKKVEICIIRDSITKLKRRSPGRGCEEPFDVSFIDGNNNESAVG